MTRRFSAGRRAMLRTAAAGAALTACATLAACGTGKPTHVAGKAAAPGTVVMIIRHGEKPDKTSPLPGVDVNGNPADSSSLTQVGWNRARNLIGVFDPPGGIPRAGIARPKTIYAAGATEGGSGERARETVTPLAQHLGITVDADFGKGDEQALADQITSQPGPTLISWQHTEIPTIAEAFGDVTPTPPSTWPSDRFDVIWTLTANGHGWTFAQVPELALPGDQTQPISD